jgi:hypothetical protein
MLPSLTGSRIVILSTHIICDIEATATHLALLNRGRLSWTGTLKALLTDAASALGALIMPQAECENVRVFHCVSSAIPRGSTSAAPPGHPSQPYPARSVPTLPGSNGAMRCASWQSRDSEDPSEQGGVIRKHASPECFRQLSGLLSKTSRTKVRDGRICDNGSIPTQRQPFLGTVLVICSNTLFSV